MLSEPKEAPEPILEGRVWDRFDPLGRPSPNDRNLRAPDGWSRREADIARSLPVRDDGYGVGRTSRHCVLDATRRAAGRQGCRRGRRRRSSLRQSGLAHAFENALRSGQIFWVTALGGEEGAGAGDGEIWVEHQARPDRRTHTDKSPELRQGGGQLKMRFRKISVGFDRSPRPRDRFLPNAEVALR